MGCASDWISVPHSRDISNTQITVSYIFSDCISVSVQFILPWSQTGGDIFAKNGASIKYTNSSNPAEYVTIRCTDTWCTSTGNLAEIEVCHVLPPVCPTPTCTFVIF